MKTFSRQNGILKFILNQKGMRISDLATVCRCCPGHVYNVITGAGHSPRVIKAIEHFIGFPIYTEPDRIVTVPIGCNGERVEVTVLTAASFRRDNFLPSAISKVAGHPPVAPSPAGESKA